MVGAGSHYEGVLGSSGSSPLLGFVNLVGTPIDIKGFPELSFIRFRLTEEASSLGFPSLLTRYAFIGHMI